MGFDVAVMAFALLSMTFGLILPVVGWATWVDVSERRILSMLKERLLAAAPAPDARDGTRAAVVVDVGDRRIEISARERGRMPLWRLVVPCASPSPIGRFVVIDMDWTTAARDLASGTFRDVVGLTGYRIALGDTSIDGGTHPTDEVLVRALQPVMHGLHLLEVRVENDGIAFDVVRDGLVPDDVWALLLRCLHVVRVLDRQAPALLWPGLSTFHLDRSAHLLPRV